MLAIHEKINLGGVWIMFVHIFEHGDMAKKGNMVNKKALRLLIERHLDNLFLTDRIQKYASIHSCPNRDKTAKLHDYIHPFI